MYSFNSKVRYSEVGEDKKLSLNGIINYFQDCSTFQSEELKVGVDVLEELHRVWVLSSWQIVVERYPALGERVAIGTVPYGLKGFLGYRNFLMMDEKGEYLAKANSLWSLLDTRTNKPAAVPQIMMEGYRLGEKLEMDYAPRRIAVPLGGVLREPVVVRQHHLDTNHHVNNQQFIDIAMDYLPEGFAVKQVRAEYKKQAFLGDVLMPRVAQTQDNVCVTLENQEGGLYVAAEFARLD